MLYCNECGQCVLLNDDNFTEVRYTSGWESNAVDPNDGDYVDYIDGETTDSEHQNYQCPHCDSERVDFDNDGVDVDTANDVRDAYTERMRLIRLERDAAIKAREKEQKAKDPNREWDVVSNV